MLNFGASKPRVRGGPGPPGPPPWIRGWCSIVFLVFNTEINYSNLTFCVAYTLSFLACHKNSAKEAPLVFLWLVGREWDDAPRPGKRTTHDLCQIKGATERGGSYTKKFPLNFLCYPGMCSICWILCQFMSFFIDFPTALQVFPK